jgi:hypothetical protein
MNEVAKIERHEPMTLVPSNMAEAMQLANLMATAKLVPVALQKSPADCLMVIQQAVRWGMDVFAVAQECSVIQGKLMHSGKLVAAVVNARGGLTQRLSFEYDGEGDKRRIIVSGHLKGEAEPRTVTVTLKEARTQNKVWQTQPDQQLMYHGTRVWARRHTPELMLGVYSPEEFDDGPAKERRAPTPSPLKMAKLAEVAVTTYDPQTGEVAPPKPDFVHFAPGSSLTYDRETGEVTDTNEPVREDDAPAAPPESPSAPSGTAYAEGHLSDDILSFEDMAREAAMRGQAVFSKFYKSRNDAEKITLNQMGDELRQLMDAAPT